MKKSVKMLLVICFVICAAIPSVRVHASTPYMKRMSVSWDLKKKKQIVYRNYYGGLGLRNEYAKIVSYSKKSAGSKYKITMKIRFECIKTIAAMSAADRDAFLTYSDGDGLLGDYNVVVADYKTGKSLYASNKYGVKVSCNYTNYAEREFASSDGEYEESFVNSYAKVTITYPKKYKNLCVGIGGSSSEYCTDEDDDYYDGYESFANTSFNCPADKRVMHFMRIK